ncbi:MAG: hypothetical protein QM784_01655 [Polyangiaceae bacterium]
MSSTFSRITGVEAPQALTASTETHESPAFEVTMHVDGVVPFAQVLVWRGGERLALCRATALTDSPLRYRAVVPAGALRDGQLTIQAEGCRVLDISTAAGEDWIKHFATLHYRGEPSHSETMPERLTDGSGERGARLRANFPAVSEVKPNGNVRIYFGIHKHMHQPYYRTADCGFWDGSTNDIFASRRGAYTEFLVDAVERYVNGGLGHAGLSASFSGSLIEQLDRCERDGLAHGSFANWKARLRDGLGKKTVLGHQRLDLVAFGHFHPLMPLIPERDMVRQIEWHREMVRNAFGVEASRLMFPPETAFHVRMIPALVKASVSCVIYDSIHRFRACKDYPYAGPPEGMLPPNRAEQENPSVGDWLQLHNIWAGSLISPSLLRPSYLRYVDPDGAEHKIIGIPAERYIGNEDARGGFGALQYPSVLGQLYDRIVETGSFDPKHPPFFLLHSDGDNFGGGTDSYYRHNTDGLVDWLKQDGRFELTTVFDYLDRFPVDPNNVEHVEPGAWSGADNGDPQFMKWFGNWDHDYSPDLNSWSVLTALQNCVHTVEDVLGDSPELARAQRLLLMAETSCYWYWTGQQVWDAQVTEAANLALSTLGATLDTAERRDGTGPTIFPPWTTPTNPGGKAWGQGCLIDAPREANLHTLISDICGIQSAEIVLRSERGERRVPLTDLGPYPTRTGARSTAHHFVATLPTGLGDTRYFIEAADRRGNRTRGALERIYLP